MGRRGPAPLPTAVVKQRGYYQPSEHKDDLADSGKLDWVHNNIPSHPEHFSEYASNAWTQILMQANRLKGYISYIDLTLLEQYCECYGELRELTDLCRGSKYYYEDNNGVKRINPIYQEKDKKRKVLVSIGREFGFSPSARSRLLLSMQPEKQKEDKYEDGL